jgi:hypothetical protein
VFILLKPEGKDKNYLIKFFSLAILFETLLFPPDLMKYKLKNGWKPVYTIIFFIFRIPYQ